MKTEASESVARTKIAHHYIVVLKDTVDTQSFEDHQAWATGVHADRLTALSDGPSLVGIKHTYDFDDFRGYAGAFHADTIEEIKARDEVEFVEEDSIVEALDIVSQKNVPSYGIARISHKAAGDLTTYYYDSSAGAGVTAYVIDTGVNIAHTEFEGRAVFGANFADKTNDDGQGHGTHVAGTIAGKTYGVAKKANIIAVKVLGSNGSGTTSGVIAGIQWATSDAKNKKKADKSVANMSLGGGYSSALNRAVAAAVTAGITFAVAAGNDNTDASTTSPASEVSAITVGATDQTDARAYYSNYGSIVDVFAPGTGITSAWIGSTTASNTISGTSMATPHVTGLAAYLIAKEGLSGSKAVTARIKTLAQGEIVTDPGQGSPTALIYNGSGY